MYSMCQNTLNSLMKYCENTKCRNTMKLTTRDEETTEAYLHAFDVMSLTCSTDVHRRSISCHTRHTMYQSSTVKRLRFAVAEQAEQSSEECIPFCVGGFVQLRPT